ncbi:MAG: DUF3667 domain-containing protein [Pseudomonadota bacterium]
MNATTSNNNAACLNCGAELATTDRYCPACGQQVLGTDARHFSTLAKSSLKEVTSLDGRVLPSFWHLIAKPGSLTRAYIIGQRSRFLKPISVFLMANLLFFLAPTLSDFNITLYDQYTLQPYSSWISGWIDAAVNASGQSFGEVAAAYNERVRDIAKIMVIVHVPFLAVVSFLAGFDRRYLFADHVVAMLHLVSFQMLYHLALPFLGDLVSLLVSSEWRPIGWRIVGLLRLIYIPIMVYVAFRFRWYRVIVVSICLIPALYFAHTAFRFIQFCVVFGLVS